MQTKNKTSPSRTSRGGGFLSPARGGRGQWPERCLAAALTPAAALCRASRRDILDDEALRAVALRALKEAVAVANASGAGLSYPAASQAALSHCRRPGAKRKATLREAGRSLDSLLSAARTNRVPVPFLSRLARLIRRLEAAA
ncbi:MAG: hypothetical protein KGI84_02330 [Elusimicrobia bacterium]|nr:hypothetical protein [Elusimicrobiota bacterium]